MKFNRLSLGITIPALVFIVVFLHPLNSPQHKIAASATGTPISTATAVQSKIHILFIGNSYTFVNDLPKLVSELAASAHESKLLETEQVTEGGSTLKLHWQNGKAQKAIQRKHWDYVVLQEHSTLGPMQAVNGVLPINNPADFYTYARLFDTAIKKAGAKTLFYMTWARQNAPQNQAIIANAYTTIASELHGAVIPVGLAWQKALQTNPTLALHQKDMSHPNLTGSYLAACVFYAAIYHKSPEGLTHHILVSAADANAYARNTDGSKASTTDQVELTSSDQEALFLQRTAWQVVETQAAVKASLETSPRS